MSKITLTNLVNLQNETTAVNAINANNAVLTAAIDNTLSRDGTAPNPMSSNLDMNSNQILNLPSPATANSPARLQDLSTLSGGGTISTLPAGGTAGQVLTKTSSTDFAANWSASGGGTVTNVGLAMPTDFVVSNSPVTNTGTLTAAFITPPVGTGAIVRATSPTLVTPILGVATATTINGGTPITSASTVGGDLTGTYPAPTIAANAITNAKLATMSAWTFKTNNTSGAAVPTDVTIDGLTLKAVPVAGDEVIIWDSVGTALKKATVGTIGTIGSVSSIAGNTGAFTLTNGITNATNAIGLTVGQLPGITTNTVASAGNIGELITANLLVGSAVALTNGVPSNITSVSLTPGHWEISGSVGIEGGTSTTVTNVFGAITTVSATLPTTANSGAYFGSRNGTAFTISAGQGATVYPVGVTDVFLSGTTTYFLVASSAFGASTLGGYGFIRARRVQ